MRIAILGAGDVGSTLAEAFVSRGHEVVLGVRDPGGEKPLALVARLGHLARAASFADAAAARPDVVFLATPWDAVESVLAATGGLPGIILVDCTNPLGLTPDGLGLVVGHTTSGGEIVQRFAPQARVVKAFNTTGYDNMAQPVYGGVPTVMFVAGDDEPSKRVVQDLAVSLGFEAIDAGPLRISRHLEAHAMLWIHLALNRGLGRDFAFALLRR